MKALRIRGGIGDEYTSQIFQEDLYNLQLEEGEAFELIINSPGGSVMQGYEIYNRLKAMPNNVTVKIEGLAASIATLIALAGDSIKMSEVSMFMIHRASTVAMGNKEELEKQAELLEKIDNTLIEVYASKTGLERDAIDKLMSNETWYNADEALEAGFIDEVVDRIDEKMAARIKENNTKNMSKFKDFLNSLTETKEEVENTEAVETTAETTEEVEAKEGAVEFAAAADLNSLRDDVRELSELVSNVLKFLEKESEESTEDKVEAKFKELLNKLPKTEGTVPEEKGSLESTESTWTAPFASFRETMSKIEAKTRLK